MTVILSDRTMREQIEQGRIRIEPLADGAIQPSSIDLRLGPVAYRVRASFLPGRHATVEQRLADLAMHKMDITEGGVLERGHAA